MNQIITIDTHHGEQLLVRQARPDDALLLADLISRLSARTRYLRYLSPLPISLTQIWAEAQRIVQQPPERLLTLIATRSIASCEEAIAVAELARDPFTTHAGEFAVLVRDDYQHSGIGSTLGARLVAIARAKGMTHLHADLLAENLPMQRLLRRLGNVYSTTTGGDIHAVLRLDEQR